MAAKLSPGLFRTVKGVDAQDIRTARQKLVFLNSDIFRIKTGGTLLDREIVEHLNDARFNVSLVQPALIQKNKRGWKPTIIGFVANFIEATRTFEKNAVVLISHGVYRDIWLAKWIWLLRYRIRIVYFVYHFDFNLKRGLSRYVRWIIESLALRGSSLVFTISESSRTQAIEMGVPTDAIRIIPVVRTRKPLSKFPNRDRSGRCVFLFVGTVEPRKGLHVALEALALLDPESYANSELRIAGIRDQAHPYVRSLIQNAKKFARHNVRFLGQISDAELEIEYLRADAFLFPSLWEGYGIAVEEAISHGLPVVSTTAGAIPEIVRDGHEAWLVEPSDAVALARAMRECIQKPDERRKRARHALDRARQLTWGPGPGIVVRDAILKFMSDQLGRE